MMFSVLMVLGLSITGSRNDILGDVLMVPGLHILF